MVEPNGADVGSQFGVGREGVGVAFNGQWIGGDDLDATEVFHKHFEKTSCLFVKDSRFFFGSVEAHDVRHDNVSHFERATIVPFNIFEEVFAESHD